MTSAVENILKSLPIDELAQNLGLTPKEAKPVVADAVSTLLAGLTANAADPAGAASLAQALPKHADGLSDGININAVDTEDGSKIVRNIFGQNTNQVVEALGSKQAAGNKSLVEQLLPVLAPIVMAYVAKQILGGGTATAASTKTAPAQADTGDILGSLLGGLLGGSTAAPVQQSSGGLGDILGSVLGNSNTTSGLGDLLGGLLGGGRR